MSVVNENTGRPPKNYSDSQWQQDFLFIKERMNKSVYDTTTVNKDINLCNGFSNVETDEYYYCGFIDDVLLNIRNGKVDYCYYIYQISELLKYEYNDLKTTWLDKERCFLVYL